MQFTDGGRAVIHPEGLLHVRAQQDLSGTDGAAVEIHLVAERSVLVGIPLKVIRSDCSTICNEITLK